MQTQGVAILDNRAAMPLPSSKIDTPLFRVKDLDEASSLIAEKICPHDMTVTADLDQLDVSFRGILRRDFQLLKIGYGSHLDVTATENRNFYFAQSTLHGSTSVYRNHQSVSTKAGETIIVSPKTRYSFNLPSGTQRMVFAVNRCFVEKYLEFMIGHHLSDDLFFKLQVPCQSSLAIWADHLRNLNEVFSLYPALINNKKFLGTQLEATATLMLALFSHNYEEELATREDNGTPRKVQRALDYIESHMHEAISVHTLAKEAALSARALQYAFKEHIGISPSDYIKKEKIAAVHAALLKADPETNITELLFNFGISSHGHFSRSYRKVYKQRLRDTLQGRFN